MRRRTISRRVLFGQAAGLAGASLLPMPAIAQVHKIKFTLAWLAQGSFSFVYMAQAKGFLKARGIDMDIARGFGSLASSQSIAAGQFDCGLVAAPTLVQSVAKGLPLIALATTDYDAMMGVGVLADSPVTKPQDLAGKKIASVPTSAEYPLFPAFAKRVGLDTSHIESVHVDNKVLETVLLEKQVDAITNFANTSYSMLLAKKIPTRWFLYSTAGIKNHGHTISVTKDFLAKEPGLCEAIAGGLLEGHAFAMTNPDETIDIFLKTLPEMALNPSARDFLHLGLLLWQRSVAHPEAGEHGLGWSSPEGFTQMTDLMMEYLAEPGTKRPGLDAIFTNRFSGKIKLSDAQWAQVQSRVAQFDKVFT
ncbi:MAG TPA: ABC transporter substrate-binding protein [Stellaceae bacterium]|jgi:ABC-type nitrate/sulfonate/bicarbonate transport system substrate-binding protein|nr:ABC transporter substrate-binding protein [Stellaceae bacterium]